MSLGSINYPFCVVIILTGVFATQCLPHSFGALAKMENELSSQKVSGVPFLMSPPDGLNPLIEKLKQNDSMNQFLAVWYLAPGRATIFDKWKTGEEPPSVAKSIQLLALLDDDIDPWVREQVAKNLRNLILWIDAFPFPEDELTKKIPSEEFVPTPYSARVFSSSSEKVLRQSLLQLAQDVDPLVRAIAISGLSRWRRDPPVAHILCQGSMDSTWLVRDAALGQLRDDKNFILKGLQDRSPIIRLKTLAYLKIRKKHMGDRAVEQQVLKLYQDKDAQLAEEAISTLFVIGTSNVVSALKKLYAERGDLRLHQVVEAIKKRGFQKNPNENFFPTYSKSQQNSQLLNLKKSSNSLPSVSRRMFLENSKIDDLLNHAWTSNPDSLVENVAESLLDLSPRVRYVAAFTVDALSLPRQKNVDKNILGDLLWLHKSDSHPFVRKEVLQRLMYLDRTGHLYGSSYLIREKFEEIQGMILRESHPIVRLELVSTILTSGADSWENSYALAFKDDEFYEIRAYIANALQHKCSSEGLQALYSFLTDPSMKVRFFPFFKAILSLYNLSQIPCNGISVENIWEKIFYRLSQLHINDNSEKIRKHAQRVLYWAQN